MTDYFKCADNNQAIAANKRTQKPASDILPSGRCYQDGYGRVWQATEINNVRGQYFIYRNSGIGAFFSAAELAELKEVQKKVKK